MYNDGKTYTKVTKERWILSRTGLVNWQNKTLSEMSDQDCVDCLKFIYNKTRTSYVVVGGDDNYYLPEFDINCTI